MRQSWESEAGKGSKKQEGLREKRKRMKRPGGRTAEGSLNSKLSY